jgi:uncharacterized membrane protein (Fun14 family)
VEDGNNLLPEPLGGIGFGGVVGFSLGFATKKLGKVLVVVGGVLIALLQVLAWLDLVVVDWAGIQRSATDVWHTPQGSLAERAWEILSNNLPFGGGFVAGFSLGFRMG